MEKFQSGNAKRFINAYNTLDHSLRLQYNFKTNMSFSDVIRRCASLNSVIHKYEDNLLDYARLRNAIIHGKTDQIIAEPHIEVVKALEKIAKLISTPPEAINVVQKKTVLIAEHTLSVRAVIELISKTGYSNLPVYRGQTLIGVANGQRIVNELGVQLSKKVDIADWCENTIIEKIVSCETEVQHFTVVDIKITIEEALNLLNSNRKLLCLIVTKSGNYNEPPVSIITNSDIIDFHKVLDNY